MTLIKTSLLNAIAVAVKMLTLLALNKILAIYVGPAGYAAIGNFQNAVQMITTFGSGAINTGVVKYTAEYHDNEEKQRAVWRTAGTIALTGSLFTALLVALFSKQLANLFLSDSSLHTVFLWFSISLVFFIFNTLLLAILNGKKEIQRYVVANIAGSIFSLIVTTFMAMLFGLTGALIALAVHPSLAFIVTICLCYKAKWFKFSYLIAGIDKKIARDLAKFAAMALTSAACVPVSHILIRNHLGSTLGLDAAGYWEAMWRLSGAYLIFVTTTLGVYFLPRFSEIKDPVLIRKEIIKGYKLILPLAILVAASIYFFRDFIINLLFTEDFIPMRDLFAWQMLGDTMKIGGWILAFLMLGKAMMGAFVITEILFSLSFYLLTFFFTENIGLEGVSIAHAVNYFFYWIVMMVFVNKKLVLLK